MKVNFSLEMKPKEFTELIEIMGMPPVVGQLDTPSMLDAFMDQVAGANAEESNPCAIADDAQSATDKASMEQAAGENDEESSPCAIADDAQGAMDKASGDVESAEETAINNRGKKILAEDSEAATASGCDCDRDAADQDEDPTDDGPAHDGLCMSTVKIYYPDTGKDVTIHKTFDPVTGELISRRTDTRFPDGKTIMKEKVYA